jgi:protein-serine/threonine kinase
VPLPKKNPLPRNISTFASLVSFLSFVHCVVEIVDRGNPIQLYTQLTPIGEGCVSLFFPFSLSLSFDRSFGTVYSAVDVNTLDQVAIKQMNIEDNYEEDLISEIGMMKTLKHPNIVRYLASFLVGSGQIWVFFQILSRTRRC